MKCLVAGMMDFTMALVLGIDAAWTEAGSSGVALLECTKGERRVIACAPSYASFVAYSENIPIDWRKPADGSLDVFELLKAAKRLGRATIDVVAIDMPVARTKITGRRAADQTISAEFGSAWASTHSPTLQRPGAYGHNLTENFRSAGYSLATAHEHSAPCSLIEVYPLAAFVRLMNVSKRPPYKASKSAKYWKESRRPEERIGKLLDVWSEIVRCLRSDISELNFKVPDRRKIAHLSELKPYEDALDAVISAYVGALFLQGAAEAFGDGEAAIWVPMSQHSRKARATNNYLTAVQETLSDWDSPPDTKAFRNL
jgi:predicted RNase H-like nuclease